jgi:hypothetical protein
VALNAKGKSAMTIHNLNFLLAGDAAKAAIAKEEHKKTGKPPAGAGDTPESLAKLPIWFRYSTTLAAKDVSATGAAILNKREADYDDLPHVSDWKKFIKEIDWHKHGFVAAFLRDVLYWHQTSTNGRFNDKLGRFERWGVKSVEGWSNHTYKAKNPHYKPDPAWKGVPIKLQPCWGKYAEKPMLSRATFFRVKDPLLEMGLIEAESHLWNDRTYLWIKPTEELSRIVFEPGYWQKVRDKYAYTPTKKKPRGVHAKAKNETSDWAGLGLTHSKNETSPSLK